MARGSASIAAIRFIMRAWRRLNTRLCRRSSGLKWFSTPSMMRAPEDAAYGFAKNKALAADAKNRTVIASDRESNLGEQSIQSSRSLDCFVRHAPCHADSVAAPCAAGDIRTIKEPCYGAKRPTRSPWGPSKLPEL